ncbi:MAG: hypothetical protein V4793_02150 [Paraburkholderia tropica]|uniref:phthiocerol/phthiodiolone dimycocerosyl transferase family protein n=1 Tax=Burkholderia gladioli TaxID=28095 RepID=UPI000B2BDE9D|nr:hypothetical protein [Burkholderia gladioli]
MIRPLSAVEHAFWLANRSVGNHIIHAAEIDGAPAPHAWRTAFDALQWRHPLLSVRIPATPGGWPYFDLVRCPPIPLRHATDAVWDAGGIDSEWLDDLIARELDEPIDHDSAPLMRAVIASGPERSILLPVVSHVIYDGISLAGCIRDLMQVLNGESLDVLPFPQSLNHLLGEPDANPPRETICLEGVRYPRRRPPAVRRLRLPRELSTRLVQRAREERTTVHGALCSAFVTAGRSLLPAWRHESVVLHSPVDLRRLWRKQHDFGFFLTSTRATIEPSLNSSTWEFAREVLRRLDPEGARHAAGLRVRQYKALLSSGMSAKDAMKPPGAEQAPDLGITNLGVLPGTSKSGRFRLSKLWGPLARGRNPSYPTVAVSTIDGCIHLTMMSDVLTSPFLENAQALLVEACE